MCGLRMNFIIKDFKSGKRDRELNAFCLFVCSLHMSKQLSREYTPLSTSLTSPLSGETRSEVYLHG